MYTYKESKGNVEHHKVQPQLGWDQQLVLLPKWDQQPMLEKPRESRGNRIVKRRVQSIKASNIGNKIVNAVTKFPLGNVSQKSSIAYTRQCNSWLSSYGTRSNLVSQSNGLMNASSIGRELRQSYNNTLHGKYGKIVKRCVGESNHCAASLRGKAEGELIMHDYRIHNKTTVKRSGSVGDVHGFSKPILLIWSATSICTGDDIHCSSAATVISSDAVEGVHGYQY